MKLHDVRTTRKSNGVLIGDGPCSDACEQTDPDWDGTTEPSNHHYCRGLLDRIGAQDDIFYCECDQPECEQYYYCDSNERRTTLYYNWRCLDCANGDHGLHY